MTTYKTYQEAKIDNPESEISVSISKVFAASDYVSNILLSGCVQGWNKCNPAEHCMTVEKFLADGHKGENGDWFLIGNGIAKRLGINGVYSFNKPSPQDCNVFILRAAALEEKTIWERVEEDVAAQLLGEIAVEEKKPRTKVEYVKCNFSREWEAVRYYNEEGELFVIDCNGNYSNVNDISGAWYEVVCKNYHCIYRRIETPMTEREALVGALNELFDSHAMSTSDLFNAIVDSGKFKLVN